MLTYEQIMAAHKANIETLFGLTHKACDAVEKLMELNIQASKAALADAASNTQAFMGSKDAQELLALQSSLVQPLIEKTANHSRQVFEIAVGIGAEFTQATEAQGSEAQQKFLAVVDNVAKNAPAGSETAVAVMKNAVSAATSAMENIQKAVKQASEIAEVNLSAVNKNIVSNVASASKAPVRKR